MIKTLQEATIKNKRVLVRVDWNVPLGSDGAVLDDFRMAASLPTIRFLQTEGAKEIILLTHLGNPVVRSGETIERTVAGNKHLSSQLLVRHAAKLLKLPDQPPRLETRPGSSLPLYHIGENIWLMENLRFHQGEMANDEAFAKELAKQGDLYVNEAFPETHRNVTSIVELPKLLPYAAGLHLLEETQHLTELWSSTDGSLIIILGGAKVADKILLVDALVKKASAFLLGGVMANTFLSAQGVDVKKSLVEKDRVHLAEILLSRSPQKFILPLDLAWDRDRALDIGPQTIELYRRHLEKADYIFWNGPMGWTDSGKERFFRGSEAIARAIAGSKAKSVVAGGDSLAVVHRYHLEKKIGFLSTGGGSTLAYLAGKRLPGLEALKQ